jgi:hypothetical protein
VKQGQKESPIEAKPPSSEKPLPSLLEEGRDIRGGVNKNAKIKN